LIFLAELRFSSNQALLISQLKQIDIEARISNQNIYQFSPSSNRVIRNIALHTFPRHATQNLDISIKRHLDLKIV